MSAAPSQVDPPICGCVWADDDVALTRARLGALAGQVAALELRLDRVRPDYPLEALFPAPAPVIATCRPLSEGGEWGGTERERQALLARARAAGANWLDLEDAARGAGEIRSRHALEPVAADALDALLDRVENPAGVSKLAVAVDDAEVGLALLERAARRKPVPLVMALGSAGVATRILGPSYGVPWVYAAARGEAPTGPGQLSVEALARVWRGGRARARAFYGVVGRPVGHSKSPALFNHAFAELGVDALYTWLETANPRTLWERCAGDPRWRGFSVTLPHKQAAAAWAREQGELTAAAEATGAVNTLSRTERGWVGDNTDAQALRTLLAERVAPGTPARVVGAGGSARAAAWALRELGAEVQVFARSEARGRALADALGVGWGGALDRLPAASGAREVLVHATPVGMEGGPTPELSLLDGELGPQVLAYELVYTPRETPLVRRARARGAEVIDGVAHFAAQARAQFSRWCARDVDADRWEALVVEALGLEAPVGGAA